MDLLRERFVLGQTNIQREKHVGLSLGYACNQTAVGTTNGAGGRNVQILVLDDDLTVLHALPGFWHAEDLHAELRLGLEIAQVHDDERLDPQQKQAMFAALHRSHLARHGVAATERGAWQHFDRDYELARADQGPRDSVLLPVDGPRSLKAIPALVHERLLARPFRKLADFDMEGFVDYGRPFYDNNAGLDKGRNFAAAAAANAKRQREQAKTARAAAKDGKAKSTEVVGKAAAANKATS